MAWDQRLDIQEDSASLEEFPLPPGLELHPLCIIWTEALLDDLISKKAVAEAPLTVSKKTVAEAPPTSHDESASAGDKR